jgi:hypothetical protein
VNPILEQPQQHRIDPKGEAAQEQDEKVGKPQQHRIDPKGEAAQEQDEKVGRDGKGHEETVQQTQHYQPPVPEVKMEDVLTPLAEKSLAQPAVGEEAISLEVLREIYARHLEALKIIDSGVGNEQADK